MNDESTTALWDKYVQTAKVVIDRSGHRPMKYYKYEKGRRLAEARDAVLAESNDWADKVKRGLADDLVDLKLAHFFGDLIHPNQQENFCGWIESSPGDALKALQAIWTRNDPSIAERIYAFNRLLPSSVVGDGVGTRMNVAAVLLMGVDVEQYPPFRVTASDNAYKQHTGYDPRPEDADEAVLYEHFLGFLDRFIEEARKRGLPIRHRLDAQSLFWIIPYEKREPGTPGDQPAEDLDQLAEELFLTEPSDFLHQIETLLSDKRQVIFQGPPGTGKTYVARKLAAHLAGSPERVTLVQFHPSYAYEDFVRGFRPTLLDDGQPGFKLTDGPLLRAAEQARDNKDEKHFLIIDEINRGQIAKVFGELYFLLEYRDSEMNLQYSDKLFSLPENLYIIGTMNTADRSIALVDLALRRRFYFVDFHPDDEPIKGVLRRWTEDKASGMGWVAGVVEQANKLLQEDRDAAIGPSYFMKDGLDDETVERVWKHSVRPYIAELLHGQPDRLDDFNLDRLRRSGPGDGGNSDGQEAGDGEAGDAGE